MPWTLTGQMVESCSCHVICPCWLPLEKRSAWTGVGAIPRSFFWDPGAKFAAIDDAAHFPMVERPEETARLLREFLESGLSPKA